MSSVRHPAGAGARAGEFGSEEALRSHFRRPAETTPAS